MPNNICYTQRLVPSPVVIRVDSSNHLIEREADIHRKSLGNFAEVGKKGLQAPRGSRLQQENTQNQINWAHKGSQCLHQQPESLHGTEEIAASKQNKQAIN